MRCSEARPLLPDFAEMLLPSREQEQVSAHIDGCRECRTEAAEFERAAVGMLRFSGVRELSGDPEAAWRGLSARLAAEVSCEDAAVRLPAMLEDSEDGSDGIALGLHIASCARCSRELAVLRHSLAVLDRVGSERRSPDLWPAFAERLVVEPRRRFSWRTAILGLRQALPVLTTPRWAGASASMVFAVVALRLAAGPMLALELPGHPADPFLSRHREIVRATTAREFLAPVAPNGSVAPARPRTIRVPRTAPRSGLPQAGRAHASVSASARNLSLRRRPKGHVVAEGTLMASAILPGEPPSTLITSMPETMNPTGETEGRMVVNEVTRAFEQIARAEDVRMDPFGKAEPNAP